MAAREGFEPSMEDSESSALPLGYRAIDKTLVIPNEVEGSL